MKRGILLATTIIIGTAARSVTQAQAGSVSEFNVDSKGDGRTRRVWVYTPPNYPEACADACSLVVAFDGASAANCFDVSREVTLPLTFDV